MRGLSSRAPRFTGLTFLIAIAVSSGCRRAPASEKTIGMQSLSGSAVRDVESSPAAPAVRDTADRRPATTPQALHRQPACDLVSRDEMAELLSAPIGAPIAVENGTTTSCSYPPGEAGSYAQADLEIDWKDVRDRAFGEQMVDAFGGTSVGRQVAHRVDLGDGGTYSNEGVLTIRARGARITVTLPMRPRSEEQAAAIGRTVLARLEDTGR